MLDPISPSDLIPSGALAMQAKRGLPGGSRIPMDGEARLVLAARGGETVLREMHQEAPCRVLFPAREAGEPYHAVLVNIAGGLVGGDRLCQDISVETGARALVTTQAAEKVYRTAGPEVSIETALTVEDGAWLEWVPQPTILFDGAHLRRRTTVNLERDATLIAGEVLILGRHAHGERLTRGCLRDRWDIFKEGRMIWTDRAGVEDWEQVRDLRAGYDGAQAVAIMIVSAPNVGRHLDKARQLIHASRSAAAATVVSDLMILRWMGRSAAHLLQDYTRFWTGFRAMAGPVPARALKIWQV